MNNLNDIMYDDYPYSTRNNDRNHPSYIISDKELINRLIPYNDFEKNIIKQVKEKECKIYLRFCDGEFSFYKDFTFIDKLKKFISTYILNRKYQTYWGEQINRSLKPLHFEFFKGFSDKIIFCPFFSDAMFKDLKKSKLYSILLEQTKIGHLYYVYHFLNKLRQDRITELEGIKMLYITHNKYIKSFEHLEIGLSYDKKYIDMLGSKDFSGYDLILLGGGISSPLYALEIAKTAKCPIIDSGYMLSIWENDNEFNDGPYTHKIKK